MSVIAKRISAIKEFPAARKAAEAVLASQSISADDKAAIEEALAQHKGNPDRQTTLAAEGEVVSKGPSKAERTAEILKKLSANEMSMEDATKALAMLNGSVELEGILNVEAIAAYPTRSLGDKGNTGWFFGGPVEIGGKLCKVSMNIIVQKAK